MTYLQTLKDELIFYQKKLKANPKNKLLKKWIKQTEKDVTKERGKKHV